MDGLNWVQMRRSLKQVDVKQLYNPVLQEIRVSWRSEFGVSCCSSRRENQVQQRAWSSGPPVEQPRRMRKKCCYSWKSWGSICCSLCSVSNSSLTHNPFATISNKVWEVYFSKELCPFVIIVLTMLPHVYVYSWLWLYYRLIDWLDHWTLQPINLSRVILCKEVKELHSLYVRIYIFNLVVFEDESLTGTFTLGPREPGSTQNFPDKNRNETFSTDAV